MIKKSLEILKKFFFLIKVNGLFLTFSQASKNYFKGGRRAVTKFINIKYKVLRIEENNNASYGQWIKKQEVQENEKALLVFQPLVTIILLHNNNQGIEDSLSSITKQKYKNWELYIVSTVEFKETFLLKKSKNIFQIDASSHKDIAEALNEAIALSKGEYITFLEGNDTFSINTLFQFIKVINFSSSFKLIYGDEDEITEEGKRISPHFKPDWNPDMFFATNYIANSFIIQKELLQKTEKFRIQYEKVKKYDLLLQCLKFINQDEIYHISKVLYHQRVKEIEDRTKIGIEVLQDFFHSSNITVESGLLLNTHKVNYALNKMPLVSIIIPTKNNFKLLSKCIESLVGLTKYQNYELLVIDNQTTQIEALAYLQKLDNTKNIKVLAYNKTFNYSAINNYAVKKASGEYLLFLNNDIEIIDKNWLTEMLQHAQRKEIGIVGAKLYYPDMSIQHAGVILGIGGVAGHAHKYFEQDAHGYFSRLKVIQNYSALTAACIVMKKSIFEEVGGFEEKLQVAFNDIDLSLKVLEKGYRNLWTPYAELIHHESKSRGEEDTLAKKERFEKEIAFMKETWGEELLLDKCYNKNLTLKDENFSLNIEEKKWEKEKMGLL